MFSDRIWPLRPRSRLSRMFLTKFASFWTRCRCFLFSMRSQIACCRSLRVRSRGVCRSHRSCFPSASFLTVGPFSLQILNCTLWTAPACHTAPLAIVRSQVCFICSWCWRPLNVDLVSLCCPLLQVQTTWSPSRAPCPTCCRCYRSAVSWSWPSGCSSAHMAAACSTSLPTWWTWSSACRYDQHAATSTSRNCSVSAELTIFHLIPFQLYDKQVLKTYNVSLNEIQKNTSSTLNTVAVALLNKASQDQVLCFFLFLFVCLFLTAICAFPLAAGF